MPMDKKRYHTDWQEIAKTVKEAAGWMCEECDKQCYRPGEKCENRQNVLTVHHKDHVPENCDPSNLIALCAPCHLKADKEHHAATRRYNAERRRAAKKLRRCIDAQEIPKDGHSGHENDQCGEIMTVDESR